MKKCTYLLLLFVAFVAFTGCKKEKSDVPASVNYATLYSVLGKNVSTATSIINNMGYTYSMDEGGESGSCMFCAESPQTSPAAAKDHIIIIYNDGVVNCAYHSNLKSGNQTKKTIDYIKNAGEVLTINGDKLPFSIGVSDDNEDMSDYNEFVNTLQKVEYEVSAIWSSAVLHRWVQYYCNYDEDDDSSELHFACYNFAYDEE